jgi:uncharacterized protein YraI
MRKLNRFYCIVLATAVIVVAASASSAMAINAPIHVTDDVNLRAGPNTGTARVGGLYRGTSPSFNCWAQGQNISGVDVWFNVTYNGATGFYASYYDDSHYATDSQITSKYGIPQCGTQQPVQPTPTPAPAMSSATQRAVSWARAFADRHDRGYQGMCLKFVFDAYSAAGVNLRPWVNYAINGNTYPQDIWGRFNHGSTGGDTPPAGALVFFKAKNGDRTMSHVALSIGGGTLVSTADGVATPVHYETMAQHSYAKYLGYWLPS